MSLPAAPQIVLVAGVPRSGSTWAFNAARRVLQADGHGLHAAWIEDYHPDDPAATHLVKAHLPAQVSFAPDKVFTTRRDPADCLASLIRMGWLANTPEAIRRSWEHHNRLYAHWHERSDLEIGYEDILGEPAAVLSRLAAVLEIDLPATAFAEIAAGLAEMRAPETGHYDPETLLHPGHRRSTGDTAPDPAEIRRIAAG